jgi:hypothetical protein
MKLPTIKKIMREDLKNAPDWVGRLIDPVNSFMESVYTALNKNITLYDNISSFIKEVTYRTPSTYPTGVDNISFLNELRSRATGVVILQAFDNATYTPVSIGNIAWIEDASGIVIYPVTGLQPSKTYTIRLAVF